MIKYHLGGRPKGLDSTKMRGWKATARIVRAARRTMQTMAGTKRRGETRGLSGEYNYIMNSITI